jgi:hypothetical protein
MVSSRYRLCRVEGCKVSGGVIYIERHERLTHWSCVCGWVGALTSFPHHYGQMYRYGHRGEHAPVAEVTPP